MSGVQLDGVLDFCKNRGTTQCDELLLYIESYLTLMGFCYYGIARLLSSGDDDPRIHYLFYVAIVI